MLTPHKGSYGYGLVIDSLFGRTHTYHGGFIDGFNTTFDRWIDDRICILVFANEDDTPVKKMARGIAAILFDKPYVFPVAKEPAELEPDLLQEYIGVYEASPGEVTIVELQDGALYSRVVGSPRELLLPQAIDTFFYSRDNTLLGVFERNEENQVCGLTIVDDYYLVTSERVTDTDTMDMQFDEVIKEYNRESCEPHIGTYILESDPGTQPESSITVTCGGSSMIVWLSDSELVELHPVSQNTFLFAEGDFGLTFISDDSGKTTACLLRWGRGETRARKVN
jgi:hypothetical protein